MKNVQSKIKPIKTKKNLRTKREDFTHKFRPQ